MRFELLATTRLELQPQLQWLWYSAQTNSFVVGDERTAYAIPISEPATFRRLQAVREHNPSAPFQHPFNLPMPESLSAEFAAGPWHGFRFLDPPAYDRALDKEGHPVGDLLRTLVFGPSYGLYVVHPAGGAVLSLRSGSLELLRQASGGFESLDQTRTRGRAVLAFAAHPEDALIVYGDNAGNFHAQRFNATKFGKAGKIASHERKASALEFISGGQLLLVGGMGYLAMYSYAGRKFSLLHVIPIAVRDFQCRDSGKSILVNQGLHGVAAYSWNQNGFTKLGELNPTGAVQQIVVSKCSRYLAVSIQDSPAVSVYSLAWA